MKSTIQHLLLIAACCVPQSALANFVFDDGERHVLAPDEPIEPPITVSNGSHLELTATVQLESSDGVVLNVVDASMDIVRTTFEGEVRELAASFQRSQVSFVDSSIDNYGMVVKSTDSQILVDTPGNSPTFWLTGESQLDVLSGELFTWDTRHGVRVSDNSRLVVNGDDAIIGYDYSELGYSSAVIAEGASHVDLYAGRVVGVEMNDQSTILIAGGEIINNEPIPQLRLDDSARAHIAGGSVHGISLSGGSQATMTGGVFPFLPVWGYPIQASIARFSSLQISGGRVVCPPRGPRDPGCFLVQDRAELTIVGSDFNYPTLEPITDPEGTITGKLADGNEFSWTFEREPNATIILIPEPSAITLSAFGFLGLLGCRRKKNAA